MSETKESLLEKIAEKVSVNLSELFKKKIELETAKLVNGVTVEYEGEDVFILNDEGERLPAPEGEHELEDGRILVVREEGKLGEIKEKESEEVEAKEEEKEMQEFASKDEVEQLKKEVEELKSMMKPKEKMAQEEKPEETELKKEEPKKEEVQLNADDAKRVNHSPEKKVEQKVKQNFSKNFGTTKDRVFARIANK